MNCLVSASEVLCWSSTLSDSVHLISSTLISFGASLAVLFILNEIAFESTQINPTAWLESIYRLASIIACLELFTSLRTAV